MAETTNDSTSGASGMADQVLSFLKEPLGIAFIGGAAIASFLAWRVF